MIFDCCNANRKNAVLNNSAAALNGIDFLEVQNATLLLHCLKAAPSTLTPDNFLIQGGESITHIGVVSVAPTSDPKVLAIAAGVVGDFSPYQLRLVGSAQNSMTDRFDVTGVLPGFDPQLAEVQFYFHAGSGPSFDCSPDAVACSVGEAATAPAIDYLAKDYGSFRTLILDRLNQLLPTAVGTSEADLAVVLAELIAYRADQLSYQQDAVATEAYIQTARSRVSLRRHARLVGYQVHDGCNARAWMQLTVSANDGDGVFMDRTLTRFYTSVPGMPASLAVGTGNEETAIDAGVQVFQPMQDAVLYHEHNLINFYTWGESQCCLAAGSTEATLTGAYPNLQPGDVLIFQEVIGPQTGNASDADLRHRCAVRLTQVAHVDDSGMPLVDPLFDSTPITQIQWSQSDALPFPLCISSVLEGTQQPLPAVSVALGNIVLADHGIHLSGIELGVMPQPQLFYPSAPTTARCRQPAAPLALPVRFNPTIPDSPLTQAAPLRLTGAPASASVMLLGSAGASLLDENGFVSLQVQAAGLNAWPSLFGVAVQSSTSAGNFDLSVIYSPAGVESASDSVVLEHFANLSLNPADLNYAPTQINSFSSLIRVPVGYSPPSKAPAGFPAAPTMLVSGSAVDLQDTSATPRTYLSLQPTPPQGWAARVGVLIQDLQEGPQSFDLSVLYCPSAAIGVNLPVALEAFSDLTPSSLAQQINSQSHLVEVQSFIGAPDVSLAAGDLMNADPRAAVPAITLLGAYDAVNTVWIPQADLLSADSTDAVFVVEIETDGTASVRFATLEDPNSALESNGLVPPAGTAFTADYRIGNGSAGNVGAESLRCLATADARIQACINPMPASGGTDPETNDQIRRRAPQEFQSQAPSLLERSITMADYEAVAENNAQVNQATANLRWTGSWYTAFIAVEPKGGGNMTPALQQTVTNSVQSCRLAGQDLQLESPQYLSLEVALSIDVEDNFFRSDVEQALLQVLGNKLLPNGNKGLFYPDNFTFGRSVYLSPIYAAARSVAGVKMVTAVQFQPQGVDTSQYLDAGEIPLGSLQIARLDNDPSFPGHGQLTLALQGGR
ncbi:MAG TPA: putative baseplate assembly protein [Steroidobacteraceae bacterium]|jgi:hypothetical protein|nr:putative baseplate assembly protein [Steroidobacteraceae bacterium]